MRPLSSFSFMKCRSTSICLFLVMLYRIMSDVDCKLIDTIESYRLCPLDFKIIRNLLWHLILQPLFDFYFVK